MDKMDPQMNSYLKKFNETIPATHGCLREHSFEKIHESIGKLRTSNQKISNELSTWKFFKSIFLTLLGVILLAVVTAIFQFAKLKSDVEHIQSKVSVDYAIKLNEIKDTLKRMEQKKTDD